MRQISVGLKLALAVVSWDWQDSRSPETSELSRSLCCITNSIYPTTTSSHKTAC